MQKYLRGQRVKIDDEMPPWMSHFHKGYEAIIDHSYSDAYGGPDDKQYSVVLLDRAGKPFNRVAWYGETQLTLINPDRDEGEKILQAYKSR